MQIRLPRNGQLWIPGYCRSLLRKQPDTLVTQHVMICVADHFEPERDAGDAATEERRVEQWVRLYPEVASAFADDDGRPPQHTFFFPAEAYRPTHLRSLAELCRRGLGEVEVHLHHDNDTAQQLSEQLSTFATTLITEHGLLRRWPDGRPAFAFIHGNWALDNSSPDGRWCGVNNEIDILRDLGCYVDMTMPSAPHGAQTRTVNSIYYAVDDPNRPKSHDRGTPAKAGCIPPALGLLCIQGPLGLSWRRRKLGVLPSVENGSIDWSNPPTGKRFLDWLALSPSVQGRPEWRFIKLHTHGCVPRTTEMFLGKPFMEFHSDLRKIATEMNLSLHYVTAREMYNIAKAAEAGRSGDPNGFRDFVLPR